MFIVALFTIAKIQKEPKCPATDKWIKKMSCVYVYVYTHIYIYTYVYTYTHTKWNFTQPLKK